jgi:hypothetical protein
MTFDLVFDIWMVIVGVILFAGGYELVVRWQVRRHRKANKRWMFQLNRDWEMQCLRDNDNWVKERIQKENQIK